MAQKPQLPFSRTEAEALWTRLVAGWANSLDASGARTFMDGIPNEHDAGGSYEGVTRMLWGLGGWLSYPDRPAVLKWRGVQYDLEALTSRALVNGCDPDMPGTWSHPPVRNKDGDQRTVEAAQVAFATWQTRERIWARLSERERTSVIGFLDQVGKRPSVWESNWALFWVLNHTARKMLNTPYEQAIIDEVIGSYLDTVYCGDGWYDDAEWRGMHHFDNYNSWVFAQHVMAWAHMDGGSMPERRAVLLDRIRNWMEHYPYFFAVDGATPEYGRSLAYKFCRLGAPLWAYTLGAWPHSAGMLKRLVGRHLRWYFNHGAVRADGTLRQTLTAGGSPEIMERYISTGASYWAMEAFSGLWSIPDDDPFWTVEEEPLPVEQGDFMKVFPQPGWIVTGHAGHIQQFSAGSGYSGYGNNNKYLKLVYSTHNPFNVGLDHGQPSLDSCLHLSENGVRGQRESEFKYAVNEAGWIRASYVIQINGHRHHVDTTLIPRGDFHLRAHRITLDPRADSVTAEEGSAALGYDGYDSGTSPAARRENGWLLTSIGDSTVGIKPLLGYTGEAQSVAGSPNSVYVYNLLDVLTAAPLQPEHNLICLVYAGEMPAEFPTVDRAEWEPDGSLVAQFNGETITVPPLAQQQA